MPQPSLAALQAVVVAQREAVADLAETLTPEQLATPSLCAGWTVQDVVAHLAIGAATPMGDFARALLRARGSFPKANGDLARVWGRRPVAELAATLRASAGHHLSNPGQGVAGPLTDALVHDADLRIPLGLPTEADPDVAAVALAFVVEGRAFGFVKRAQVAGLGFLAEDVDGGAAFGEGPVLRGRALDLLAAACGRAVVLDRLTGPGVAELARRLG